MQITETKSEGLSREYTINLPADEIEEKVTHKLKKFSAPRAPDPARAKSRYLSFANVLAKWSSAKSWNAQSATRLSRLCQKRASDRNATRDRNHLL